MDYFSTESEFRHVGDIELQNRLDRITIGGGSITRDEAGLATARALAELSPRGLSTIASLRPALQAGLTPAHLESVMGGQLERIIAREDTIDRSDRP